MHLSNATLQQGFFFFFKLGTIDILDWIILCGGGRPGHCRVVAASLASTQQMPVAPSPSCDHPKGLQMLPHGPWGTKLPQLSIYGNVNIVTLPFTMMWTWGLRTPLCHHPEQPSTRMRQWGEWIYSHFIRSDPLGKPARMIEYRRGL